MECGTLEFDQEKVGSRDKVMLGEITISDYQR